MTTPQLIVGLLWLLAVFTAEASAQGNLVLKSFQRAKLECKQYLPPLDDSDGLCQSRCEAIALHSWDDCSGLLYVPYSRHFQPDRNDKNYLNRTLRCLDAGLENVSSEAVCCKASVYWRCYRDQWGNLIGTPQLVPLSKLQISSTIEQCAQMLQVNHTELQYFARNHFDVSDRSRCLMRCMLIRKGLYSDASGPDLDRMYVQCGGYSIDEETFKRNASECIDRLRGKCYDKCTLATRIVVDCFPIDAGPVTGETLEEVEMLAAAAIDRIVTWMQGAKLQIAHHKTEVMLVSNCKAVQRAEITIVSKRVL
ncbi:general odorant-binding protein 45-like [Ochlerotatus camptorhynchus]|uniref:general odorant-binding protein 45-like n=1 Tax=Ochlerotatus camptorhynchus TaxID=644619 RepID=UPI0031DF8000